MKTNNSILKIVLLLVFIPLLIISCDNASYKDQILIEKTGERKELNSFNEAPKEYQNDIRKEIKIIRNATIKIKVGNVNQATRIIKEHASSFSGYISDERMSNTNYAIENRFTIRVPQEYFDNLLDSVSSLAEFIEFKNISTVDVTNEYVDINSRLKTKREVKNRYETILRNKTKTVEDVLNAEEKIRILQEEIEVAEGRLRYISNSISYSTIQVDLYQTVIPVDEPVIYKPSFADKSKDGLSFGWSIVEGCVLLILNIWPIIIILAGVVIYLYWKKRS